MNTEMSNRKIWLLVCVAALGYFVDIYDLIVFNVVKYDSFQFLHFTEEQSKSYEISLFQLQMAGMLFGGLLWGILGDKKGRVSVLFGSIILYSIANIMNAFVHGYTGYAFWRVIAGIGLAGELGAGVTLVNETMKTTQRGLGTMVIVAFGALGAVVAYIVGRFGWREAYIGGGVMGILLLLMRAATFESGMFHKLKESDVSRGNFFLLFNSFPRFWKYLRCILIGLPIWFIISVLMSLSTKFHDYSSIGIAAREQVGQGIMWSYVGLCVGDIFSGLLSQLLRSRRKVILIYLITTVALVLLYLFDKNISYNGFRFLCFLLGAGTGYWALFVTNASEQFGTNLRSTVTTTVPNFVRGSVIIITWSFKSMIENTGANQAALIIGGVCIALAFLSAFSIHETFHKELDYYEVS